jgi:hypothetical protein
VKFVLRLPTPLKESDKSQRFTAESFPIFTTNASVAIPLVVRTIAEEQRWKFSGSDPGLIQCNVSEE